MIPKKGDKIYVPTSLYLSHGRDDFQGGTATVEYVDKDMNCGKVAHIIGVKERPDTGYYWENWLRDNQEKWKKEYGDQIAHADPDLDPRMNMDD